MSYLEFFSWKYYFGIQRFYVCPDVPVDIIRVFFLISDFLAKVSKPTKASKKDHTFYNTVPLKKPHSFYEPQIASHWKQYPPAAPPKNFLTLKISNKHVSVWCHKKYLHYIIS